MMMMMMMKDSMMMWKNKKFVSEMKHCSLCRKEREKEGEAEEGPTVPSFIGMTAMMNN